MIFLVTCLEGSLEGEEGRLGWGEWVVDEEDVEEKTPIIHSGKCSGRPEINLFGVGD